MPEPRKQILILGAGPAGLTAAYEIATKTNYQPIIIEQLGYVGGIASTINHHGNKIDIGGHRFFSKSDKVVEWWLKFLPLYCDKQNDIPLSYQGLKMKLPLVLKEDQEPRDCFLIRERVSRILYNGKFFDYPLKLTFASIYKLGIWNSFTIGLSYFWARLHKLPETNLENFFINRFGKSLYLKFFKNYTEKVWGVPCQEISADWGAQRIKGLSLKKAITDYLKKIWKGKNQIPKEETETSLIEYFMYPKYGPGHFWEKVKEQVETFNGKIYFNHNFEEIKILPDQSIQVKVINTENNSSFQIEPAYLISTVPISELIKKTENAPKPMLIHAQALEYRDFITVGLLIKKEDCVPLTDTWIYIHDPQLKVGRLQIFNNWSPALVADPKNYYWFGLEYFTNSGDELWMLSDEELKKLAANEIIQAGIALPSSSVTDSVVIRVKKTYPSYIRGFKDLEQIKVFVNSIERLFLIGRNGMHRYNNQDHSMLTAIEAVNQIINQKFSKEAIWSINTEQEYQESK